MDEIDVTATEGEYFLAIIDNGLNLRRVPFDASDALVREKLEEMVGTGNVEVSGGELGPGGRTYTVKFVGAKAGVNVNMRAVFGASVKALVEGAPSGVLRVTAVNVGGAATDGSTVTLSDALPPELATLPGVKGHDVYIGDGGEPEKGAMACATSPVVQCSYAGRVDIGDQLVIEIPVALTGSPPATDLLQTLSVSGGGADPASTLGTLTFSASAAPFGLMPGSMLAAVSSSQAGAHADVTTSFAMNSSSVAQASGALKDVRFDAPAGLVGNTIGIPRCTMTRVIGSTCPADAMVGTATVVFTPNGEGINRKTLEKVVPIYSIEPATGEPVAFAFSLIFPTRLDTSVLSDGDYAVRVSAPDITETASVLGTTITLWGVPADHQAPGPNGEGGFTNNRGEFAWGAPAPSATRVPLLTNPSQCSSPLEGMFQADSWTERGVFVPSSPEPGDPVPLGRMTGCNLLSFASSLSMLPDTLEAGAPAGYALDLNVAQNRNPNGLDTPNVKKVVATLPMGTVISPSAAWGLQACSDAAFGLHSGVPAACPREAQVGTVRIKTPALEEAFEGEVYLGSPSCDPCTPADAEDGRMVRLFVQVVGEGESGIVVKLEGKGQINRQTGQITTVFDNNPQLPFSQFKLTLGGGPRATLANPRACGPATTTLDLTPWSTPFSPDSTPSSTFEIDQGCFGPRFNPSFVAGTTSIQAGEYSPFTLSFGRSDQEEFLAGLQLHMPAGLLGSLSGIPLCKEPDASVGSCPAGSLIGHTQVLTGPGADPFLVSGGQVFLTESYKGAPFGLSIVVPAQAGPYTLSGTTGTGMVVVRAAINIDPHTTALTVTSDPLPTMLDGIPLQLKAVNVTIDRPGFTLNPTSCAKTTIVGSLSSTEGASVNVSTPFQVTNCAGLGFKPQFKVSTSGRTSRKDGASLDAKVIYPAGAKLANVAKVKVDLPKQLPSRLTTLQKACPAATFNANPGLCPADSRVGIAKASTPILPVQLNGPAYFVSHGGEAFPNLIVVLQGYGVRVDLIGDTFINKAGITSSTFTNVPDVPISSFELYLPEGPFSALAANGNLCKSKLKMPTAFTGQNGMTIHQSTPIAVTGCGAKASKARRAGKARAHGARGTRTATTGMGGSR